MEVAHIIRLWNHLVSDCVCNKMYRIMVATVYTPNGIVVATASYDSFHEHLDTEDGIQISPINIEGLTHTYLFYNKYSLTFNGLNSYTANSTSKCKITKCLCKSTPLVLRNSISFLVSH